MGRLRARPTTYGGNRAGKSGRVFYGPTKPVPTVKAIVFVRGPRGPQEKCPVCDLRVDTVRGSIPVHYVTQGKGENRLQYRCSYK